MNAELGGNAAELVGQVPGGFWPAGRGSHPLAHSPSEQGKQLGRGAGPAVEAVGVPGQDVPHERIFELRRGRFLAIVVIVCSENRPRPMRHTRTKPHSPELAGIRVAPSWGRSKMTSTTNASTIVFSSFRVPQGAITDYIPCECGRSALSGGRHARILNPAAGLRCKILSTVIDWR